MQRSEILAKVKTLIMETTNGVTEADITEDASFQGLGLDSLKLVELSVRVEDVFGEDVILDDWVEEESVKGVDGFKVASFLDYIERTAG